ncbi:MAG: DNA/RNA non-specific endonuclease [Bacteroides sp.]|nr:DNA/RNA non-specific endonuclease [Bacteroides sp.]MCM1379516.1 DNA/RNA non-specific endonuclease [Bacteroides sp.]MCM1445881.1 DNA/RNA non-specific endonuclease [Prevotella sp.]
MRKHQYHDKMPWLRTLCLVAVAVLLIYIMIIAFSSISNAHGSLPAAQYAIPSAKRLMEVKAPAHGTEIDYENFSVDFNPELHIPNYVVWELTAGETTGNEPRGKFMRDYTIDGCPTSEDYTNSGYDRGHMAPAADMKFHPKAMKECFYMTNICPQSKALNSGAWKKLEEKCRLWAQADSAIIIVCGPILKPEPTEFIGKAKVAVPQAFFKVICSPYANPPRAIGFIMNNGKVAGGLQAAAVSVDSVETLTGYDFFAPMPDSIENAMEAECRFHFWSTIKPNA